MPHVALLERDAAALEIFHLLGVFLLVRFIQVDQLLAAGPPSRILDLWTRVLGEVFVLAPRLPQSGHVAHLSTGRFRRLGPPEMITLNCEGLSHALL